jgi:hypothetical protein
MKSEEKPDIVITEVCTISDPLPQHIDEGPLAQASITPPRRRLNTRRLYQRRRQRLQELIQQQATEPASQ